MILSILMLLSVIPLHSSTIYADGSRKAIMIGTGDIKGYDKTTKKYDSIYFGVGNANIESHKEKPIQWRVLDNTDKKRLFLLSKTLMGGDSTGDIEFNSLGTTNEWQGSDAQKWCRSFIGEENQFNIESLIGQEPKAILPTTKNDSSYGEFLSADNILNGDKVFFLSAEEAEKYFTEDEDRKANYGQDKKALSGWWLRSPHNAKFDKNCGIVETSGKISYDRVHGTQLVRPAFNLDTTKVLFTSPAVDGKQSNAVGKDALKVVENTDTTEWKLTLKDDSRKEFKLDTDGGKKVERQDSVLTIPYKNATTGANEYISAVVEKNGSITHYGNIKYLKNQADNTETATVQLPADFDKTTDTLYLINEQLNGDKKTDYSSEKVEVKIPEEQPQQPTKYTVTMENDGNGTATANPTKAKQGDIISINAEANKGFKFKEWQVVAGNPVSDNQVRFDKTDEDAKFKMPAENVTIEATFGKLYKIAVKPNDPQYGTAKATVDGVVGDIEEEMEGTEIKLEATPNGEYKFVEWKGTDNLTFTTGNKNSAVAKFKMPAKAVEITAIFDKPQQPSVDKFTVTVTPNPAAGGTATASPSQAEKDKEVTISAEPNGEYKFVEWKGTDNLTFTTGNKNSAVAKFKMPAKAVEITAIFDKPQQPSEVYDVIIKSNNPNWGSVDISEVKSVPKNISPVENDNKLIIGKEKVTATAKKGYKFKEWGGEDSGEPNKIIYVAKFEQKEYKIKLTNDGRGTATASSSQAKQGEKVTITATPERGYKFDEWRVISGDVTLRDKYSATTTFIMPDEDVEVKAYFKKKSSEGSSHDTEYYNITTKTDKHGTVEARSKAKEGTEVSVTVSPDKGYKLDEITVTDKRGRDITIKETNRENRYKFTMPARDVTVEATFKQIKQEQPSKPTTPPTIPPTNNNKPIENNIIKKQQTTVFTIGSNIMTVITDGKATQTTIDAKPFLSQGRVMIPVRYAAESLGMQVEWNKQTQTVVLKDRENTVMIPIKTNKIIVGNQEYTSDVTPILKNGRTYLTISNIAKALRMRAGQDVKWDNKIKQVTIIKEVEVR